MKKGLLLLVLSGCCWTASASFDYTTNLAGAYQNILRLRLDDAEVLLHQERIERPQNSLTLLYANYFDFIKAFITEEKKYADTLRLNTERRLRELENADENSPFYLFSRAEMLVQTAMIKAKFRENVSAALDIHKAYKLASRNFIKFPTFALNKKILGLLHAMVGAIPTEYRWLISLAGMEGTIPQGTDELFRMFNETNRGVYPEYKEEVLFYLVQVYSAITTNDSIAAVLADSVRNHCHNNPLMVYSFMNLTYKSGKNEEALQMINSFDGTGTFPFYFLQYKKAQLLLRKLDPAAKDGFEFYLSHFHGLNYIKSAYQKLAWIAWLNHDEKRYDAYLDSCLHRGIALVDEDKDALREAQNREKPNPILLRARLLFDGGYYSAAFAELKKITSAASLSFHDQLEFTYRYARLFHKTGNLNSAISNYNATLQKGETASWYFAANSALMLGMICEEKGELSKAREYYQHCLDMRHHDYQNSIDQKAQAALERLSKLNH